MEAILFSTPMVQAILADIKKATRRPIKISRPDEFEAFNDCRKSPFGADVPCYVHRAKVTKERRVYYPHYDVGDILYVRETWAKISDWTEVDPELGLFDGYIYRANWDALEQPKWRPSIHMSKEAARIFLRVTDVRAERLQEITEEQAVAEGFSPLVDWHTGVVFLPAVKCFEIAWDKIYAAKGYGWESNPWVFAYKFEQQRSGGND